MTNFEKYKERILDFIANNKGPNPVVVGGKVIDCSDARCSECEFGKKKKEYAGLDCSGKMLLWLCEEYQEPEPTVDWSKVAVDTKVLVSDDSEEWHKRYFASYEDGRVYVWGYGATSWSNSLTSPYNYAKLAEEDADNDQRKSIESIGNMQRC